MLKFLNCIFALSILVATQNHAHQVNLALQPKASKLITNHFASTLTASCVIKTATANNKIVVSVLENKGRINGRGLSKGQARAIKIHNNQTISVSADPGAQVNLYNLGAGAVNASCTT